MHIHKPSHQLSEKFNSEHFEQHYPSGGHEEEEAND